MTLSQPISVQTFDFSASGAHTAYPVASGAKIFQGSIVCLNSSGYAVPGQVLGSSPLDALSTVGIAKTSADNTDGDDGDVSISVASCTALLINDADDPIDQSRVTKLCYVTDERTVSASSGAGARAVGGIIMGLDDAGVYVALGPLVSGLADRIAHIESLLDIHDYGDIYV